MESRSKWILALPVLLFGFGTALFVRSQNEARVQFIRAQEQWRSGNYTQAVEQYRSLQQKFPGSRYGGDALWELANIYYVNLYDLPHAIEAFNELVRHYPRSPLALQARLKAAEIYLLEFDDIARAIEIWRQLLAAPIKKELRHQIQFQIAEANFQAGELESAFEILAGLIKEGGDEHLLQQARVLTATILQIRKEYKESIDIFQQVLESTVCAECVVQAQLGLIESFEFLDQLPRAIEIAEAINVDYYPEALKEDLLRRLSQKRKYYEPEKWDGR